MSKNKEIAKIFKLEASNKELLKPFLINLKYYLNEILNPIEKTIYEKNLLNSEDRELAEYKKLKGFIVNELNEISNFLKGLEKSKNYEDIENKLAELILNYNSIKEMYGKLGINK